MEAQRLQIKVAVMEYFKKSSKYHGKLREYAVRDFLTYFNEVTCVMTKKGLDITLLVLVEPMRSLVLSKLTQYEATRLRLGII